MRTAPGPLADVFARELSVLDLPTDRDRTAARSDKTGVEPTHFDRTLVEELKHLAYNDRTSLAAPLLAGFNALLYRLTGQDDIVVGVAVDVRSTGPIDSRLESGLDLTPVRCQFRGSQTFRELVDSLNLLTGGAQAMGHQAQDRRFDLSTSSLHFQVVDLSLTIHGSQGELDLECEYNADLFDATTVRRWLEGYRRLLLAAAANADAEIGALRWVSVDDLRLVEASNSTAKEFPTVCIHDLVEAQARRAPHAIAVQFETRAVTYDELNRRANQLARRLRDLGVAKNALVGLCVDRSIDMLVGLLGILKAGGAYVPLDPAYPVDRLAFMMTDSGMRVLVTERGLGEALAIPPGVQTLCIEDPSVPALDAHDLPRDVTSADPDSLAYVIYTSGSTGQPKGVLVPHRAVANLLSSVAERPGLTANDVVLAITTLSFDIAVSELLLPLSVGARIVLATREVASDGVQLLQLIRDAGVTFVDATPSTWRLLIDAGWNGGEELTAICTGEAMPRDLARELVERAGRVWNGYGPTETTVWSTFFEVRRPVDRILIGTPIANTRIHILDERMQPVAVGVLGEIYIAGVGVTCGYLNRPDLTLTRFVPDPFDSSRAMMYRTGDIGRYLPTGQIECLGRNDDQVKIRGFRIELGEIEEALTQHVAIARAAVIAREDRPGDRRLVGYVVVREDHAATDTVLRAHLSRALPDHMIPATFVRLNVLPLTPSGKVNRRGLPVPPAARRENDAFIPARTPTEAMLADLWQQALGLEHVGVDDDFFLLGGHSLLASHVLARLRRDHGIEILFRTLFEAPTIAQLATLIDARPRSHNRATRTIARRVDGRTSRLSVAQERMWLLEVMDPHQRVVHNLPCAWRLSGELDEAVLERALNEIVARHETLRTRIGMQDGVPFQAVAPVATMALGRLDLRDYPETQREAEMLAYCHRDSRTPHDLSVAPLCRATLIRLDELEHVLFIVPHNLIWDGWSFDIFQHELSACYAAFVAGRPSPLAELFISYRDFAGWQRDWLAGEESAMQRAWWRTQLDGHLPVLEIPSDCQRPAEPTRSATHIKTHLSREQVGALSAISAKSGGTLFTILFAAFCLLLHRLSDQDDLIVGTPVRARTRPETEDLIGLFMNMLVLRSHVDRELTFTEYLAGVRTRTIDAFSHQELPLEALDVRAPILRAFFTMEDGRRRPQKLGSLDVRPVPIMPTAVAADLRLSPTETRDGVSLVWTCSSELFDGATTERFLERFRALLTDVARDPHRKVSELDLVPEDERALLHTFGEPAPSTPTGPCVHALFERHARERPGAPALVCGAEIVEYGQLDRRAANLAHVLGTRGIGNGSRVGVYLTRSAELVVSLLAVMKVGAAWVPLDPDDPPARLTAILEDSAAGFVLTNESLRSLLPARSPRVVCLEEAPETPGVAEKPADIPSASATPDAPACLLYTSDAHELRSAELSQRTLAALVETVIHELLLTQGDVALAISPPSLDISVIELLAPLAAGAQIVIVDGDLAGDAERFLQVAATSAATLVIAPTTLWADALAASTEPWARLKAICIGNLPAAEVAAGLVARTAGAWVAHGFPDGGIWTTLRRLTDSEPTSVLGRPVRGARVRILDRHFCDVPLGAVGELYIGVDGHGDGRVAGHGAPDRRVMTSIHGLTGAWLRTGEGARWRNDGAVELVNPRGRETHVAGFRVDLDDISSVLRRLPSVQDAAVVLQTQAAQHARLVAYVVPQERVAFTATEWRRDLRQMLPERMIPRSFIEIEAMPRRANDQLDLESLASAHAPPGDDYVPPRTATEILLAQVWKDALGLPRVGVHDNFFALGGYSLLCFQVLERIERESGHRLSPRLLLLDSLQQVAAQLDTKVTGGDAPKIPLERPKGGFFRRFGRLLPGSA